MREARLNAEEWGQGPQEVGEATGLEVGLRGAQGEGRCSFSVVN